MHGRSGQDARATSANLLTFQRLQRVQIGVVSLQKKAMRGIRAAGEFDTIRLTNKEADDMTDRQTAGPASRDPCPS